MLLVSVSGFDFMCFNDSTNLLPVVKMYRCEYRLNTPNFLLDYRHIVLLK